MNELRDVIEKILTIAVGLGAIALAWVAVSVVVGMSFGLAVRAARFVTG